MMTSYLVNYNPLHVLIYVLLQLNDVCIFPMTRNILFPKLIKVLQIFYSMFKSYLNIRSQRVKIYGKISSKLSVNISLPYGFSLGLFLFIL